MVKYSATFKGKGSIKNFGGGKTKWKGREIDWFGVDQKKNASIEATLKLTGANWTVNALQVDAKKDNEFTRLFDVNANGGRFIGAVDVGNGSDIDLKSTSIGFLRGGGGSHDVVLGSGTLERARFDGDATVVTGDGEVGSLRIDGTADVTVNAGGAGRIRTGDGDDSITVDNGTEIDAIRTGDGNDTVTVQGGSDVALIRTGNGAGTVTVTDNSEAGIIRMGDTDDVLVVSDGARVDAAHLRDGNDTVTVDNAELRDLWLDGGNDSVTVQNGGKIFHVFSNSGDNSFTLTGDSKINSLELGPGTSTIDAQDSSGINTFTAYEGSYDVGVVDGGIGAIDGYQATFDVAITGSGWINAITLGGAIGSAHSIDVGSGYLGTLIVRDAATDLVIGDGSIDFAQLGDLGDTVTVGTGYIRSIDTRGGDDIVNMGNGGAFAIQTGLGNDLVITGSGFVGTIDTGRWTLEPGETDDDVVTIGSGGVDLVITGAGDDVVTTGSGWAMAIEMGSGNDIVTIGSGGAGRVSLGTGDDTLAILECADPNNLLTAFGGAGVDTLDFSGWTSGSGVTIALNSVEVQNPGAPGGSLTAGGVGYLLALGFENVIGTAQDDVIIGNDADNTFTGGAGADVFVFEGGFSGPATGTDTVTDFEQGVDLLSLANQDFGDLTIVDDGDDLRITHDNGVIILEGHAGTTLTEADFLVT